MTIISQAGPSNAGEQGLQGFGQSQVRGAAAHQCPAPQPDQRQVDGREAVVGEPVASAEPGAQAPLGRFTSQQGMHGAEAQPQQPVYDVLGNAHDAALTIGMARKVDQRHVAEACAMCNV